jgi:hypothetical protein
MPGGVISALLWLSMQSPAAASSPWGACTRDSDCVASATYLNSEGQEQTFRETSRGQLQGTPPSPTVPEKPDNAQRIDLKCSEGKKRDDDPGCLFAVRSVECPPGTY